MVRGLVLILLSVFTIACEGMHELDSPNRKTETLNFGVRTDAIRNGTREPSILGLNDGQKLAVGWLHPTGAPGQNFCTATLVAPRVLATARHCLEGQQRFDISFGVGLLPSAPRASFRVETGHLHPIVDAAILILEQDAVEALPDIQPIPFNRKALEQSLVGTEVEAAGYGETYDRTRSGRYFAVVQLAALTSSEVIVDGRGRQGLCFGDSGGPVMTLQGDESPVVLGVESWGDPSCVGVDHLVRLDAIAPWIDSMTESVDREPDPECMTLPDVGECRGDVIHRCQNGRYIAQVCDEETERCGVADTASGQLGCVPYDPCAEAGSAGRCDGETVVRCRFGDIVYEDCASDGKVCTRDAGGAFCIEDKPLEPSDVAQGPDAQMDEAMDTSPSDIEANRDNVDEGNPEAIEEGPFEDVGTTAGTPTSQQANRGGQAVSMNEESEPGPSAMTLFDPQTNNESNGSTGGCSAVNTRSSNPFILIFLCTGLHLIRRIRWLGQ